MSDPSPLDAPPLSDAMEVAFDLPTHIAEDSRLAALFFELRDRYRHEAEGIPLATNQLLMISQIALGFVEMKYNDEHQRWVELGVNAKKDHRTYWLDLVKEWNRLLKDNREELRDVFEKKVSSIIFEGVKKIPDENVRRDVYRFYQEKLAAAGS